MMSEHLKSVLRQYQTKLDVSYPCISKRQMSEDEMGKFSIYIPHQVIVDHCKFMCTETERLVEGGDIEKAMRWLGFLQGLLWSLGLFSLDDLKKHSKAMPVEE